MTPTSSAPGAGGMIYPGISDIAAGTESSHDETCSRYFAWLLQRGGQAPVTDLAMR